MMTEIVIFINFFSEFTTESVNFSMVQNCRISNSVRQLVLISQIACTAIILCSTTTTRGLFCNVQGNAQ
jgi:hypothetical protein